MFLTIIIFLLILSLLVFAHELGHFLTARKFGIKVEEFGFGFPPRALGFRLTRKKEIKIASETEITVTERETEGERFIQTSCREEIDLSQPAVPGKKWEIVGRQEEDSQGGTIYSLNWIPLGGFVKIKGENGEGKEEPDSFSSRPVWQRLVVIASGVLFNVFLAFILLTAGFSIGLPQLAEAGNKSGGEKYLQIVQIVPDSPAAQAGFKPADIIVNIDGTIFKSYEELVKFNSAKLGQDLNYKIKRGREEMSFAVKPKILSETKQAGIGVAIAEMQVISYPWYQAAWEGAKVTVLTTGAIITAFYELIKNLVSGRGVSADLTGPVGIAVMTGQAARLGWVYLLQFTVMLSLNLAVINFLPFPALDGGRALFLLIEKIKGSPVKQEVEAAVHNIGFILLMALVLVVTFKDIGRYGKGLWAIWGKLTGGS